MAAVPWQSPLAERLILHFKEEIIQLAAYQGQPFLICRRDAVVPLLEYLRLEKEFDYLVDLTAVDYPVRPERFELVYIVYSYPRNERIRLKTSIPEDYRPRSAVSVHLTANWLEREVYDMFGIKFDGHPNLRRILLPDEWQGHPLRKDYGITQMDNRWVQENLGIESGQ